MFKKGDRVEVTENSGGGGFKVGEVYIASRDSDGMVWVEEDSLGRVDNGWSVSKFRHHEVSLQTLLAKAKELYDKGLITGYGEGINTRGEKRVTISPTLHRMRIIAEGEEEKGLKYLQSLEVETFKIGIVEDILRVKLGAKGKLSNGFNFYVIELNRCTVRGVGVTVAYNTNGANNHLYYEELKGATITQ